VPSSDAAQSAPADDARIAGGETTEFSGGSVPFGYCPRVTSRTSLDVTHEDVAKLVALAAGHHEVPLHWRREFPDERIRGFAESTTLLLDVQVTAAEEVVCASAPDDTSYETSGFRAMYRRLELAVEFSTADGAVRGSFQAPFVMGATETGERYLFGGDRVSLDELQGTLDLGVDPEIVTDPKTLSVDITFSEQSVHGALTPWVILSGGGKPSWVPVSGTFPASDEGCEGGTGVPLDEPLESLGDTPRAAYELARARLPAQPLRAVWHEAYNPSSLLSWTELTLSAGAPTHACLIQQELSIYAPLRVESADGRLAIETAVSTRVGLQPAATGPASAVSYFSMSAPESWTQRTEFEANAGIRDLDLGTVDYAALRLFQEFRIESQVFDIEGDQLQGELSVRTWVNYHGSGFDPVYLDWCAGACEAYWCGLVGTNDGSSCP